MYDVEFVLNVYALYKAFIECLYNDVEFVLNVYALYRAFVEYLRNDIRFVLKTGVRNSRNYFSNRAYAMNR